MKTCQKCGGRFEDALGFCPRDGEVLTKDHAGLVGRTLDNQYEIEKFIAAGGMGAVYRARHILLGDTVAIKILSPEMSGNAEWLKRFQREGQMARKFRHPNAVLVHDLRTSSDGLVYMVMEYVEGRTLDAYLRERGRLTPQEALTVLEPVAGVLDAAHSMGVVHRDLKPENVMLGTTTIKLLDLGIAKMREIAEGGGAGAPTSLTVAGQILGTPYYMSPEQWGEIARDGSTEIDGRADIYSMGVMFYELIAGRKPFGGQTLAELRRGHISFTPPPLGETAPDVPAALGRAVERALAKDRNDRQQTAQQLIADVRASLDLDASLGATNAHHYPTETSDLSPAGKPANDMQSKTSADHIAATLIGDDALATAGAAPPPSSAQERAPETVAQNSSAATNANAGASPRRDQFNQQPPLPTMATAAPMIAPAVTPQSNASAAAVAAPATAPQREAAAAKPKRSPLIPLALGAVALVGLIVIIGALGWYAWKQYGDKKTTEVKHNPSNVGATNTSVKPERTTTIPADAVAPREVMNWWLAVAPQNGPDDNPRRAAGEQVAIGGKDKFKFTFLPREPGYLYLIGPGEKNTLMAFLTAQPTANSGVTTNRIEAGREFQLSWMGLNNGVGAEKYTVVFSPAQLIAPSFFTARGEHKLTATEQVEWNSFLSEHKANAPAVNVKSDGAGGQTAAISSAQSATQKNAPIVFDINIGNR